MNEKYNDKTKVELINELENSKKKFELLSASIETEVIESLRFIESKHESIMANISDVIGIISTDGIIKYKSPNIEKWFGWKPEDLVGKIGTITVHPDDCNRITAIFYSLLHNDKSVQLLEFNYQCKDGTYKPIALTATSLISDPAINGVLLNYHDITNRKKNEVALRESEKQFRTLFERSNDAIFFVDIQTGNYLDANKSAQTLTGRTLDEIKNSKVQEISPSGVRDRIETLRSAAESIDMGEIEYIRPDGTSRIAYLNTIPLNNGLVFGIAQDITERKKTEIEIQSKNEQLTKANADKDRFMSILAHDLRSPFQAILGLADVLATNVRSYPIEKIEKYVQHIFKSSQNTYNLLEDLLMWIQSQSGKIPFEPQTTNFGEICREVLEVLSPMAQLKNISIYQKYPTNLTIFADTNMFKTILRNIISNAIKFTNTNGQINIGVEITNSKIILFVSDNGVGMTTEYVKKIFDITQTHTSKGTNNESGTGLGLLLCKEFIEKHQGKIWVNSQLGVGSTFYFSLPINID